MRLVVRGEVAGSSPVGRANLTRAPIAQSVEVAGRKLAGCGFESHWGHHFGSIKMKRRSKKQPPVWEVHGPNPSRSVKFDPSTYQLVTHQEIAAQRDHYMVLGEERGYARGYNKGAMDVKNSAFEDLSHVWLEVSRHMTTAANYAATIARMYRPATRAEEKGKAE